MIASAKPTDTRATKRLGSPFSTLAFDWVYIALVFLVTVGIYMDGWSHSSFGPDQSVFSEYHLLFYSSLMALGLWLFGNAFLNRRQGFSGLDALPAGYRASAFGLLLFGVTGVLDLGGHALFGFEVDNEALYSPTHIGLFFGWAMLSVGPTRAALLRQTTQTSWWQSFRDFLPALLAWISFFNVLAFISVNFFGTSGGFMLVEARGSNDYYAETLGIMGIIIQTAMTVGVLSWLVARFRLPAGSFTLFFLLYGLYGSIWELSTDLVPVFLAVGILTDLGHALLKPTAQQPWRYHGFNVLVAFIFWATFYAFVFTTNYGGGVWYTPYIWLGSITQAMTTALLVSLLSTSTLTLSPTRTT